MGNLPDDVVEMVERVKAGTPADTLEGQRLEFKTGGSVHDELTKIAEAAACLANADGGLVIVGVHRSTGWSRCPRRAQSTVDGIVRHLVDAVNPPLTVGVNAGAIDGMDIIAINVIRGVHVHALSDGQVKGAVRQELLSTRTKPDRSARG